MRDQHPLLRGDGMVPLQVLPERRALRMVRERVTDHIVQILVDPARHLPDVTPDILDPGPPPFHHVVETDQQVDEHDLLPLRAEESVERWIRSIESPVSPSLR